jgi:hypothetical protein
MSQFNWILGNSIDNDNGPDLSENEMFVGYLVHLAHPRCVMLVCQPGLMEKTPIPFDYDSGYFYRSKDGDLEIIIIQWLDDDTPTPADIKTLLLSAATHLEIHMQSLYEGQVKQAFPIEGDDDTDEKRRRIRAVFTPSETSHKANWRR